MNLSGRNTILEGEALTVKQEWRFVEIFE